MLLPEVLPPGLAGRLGAVPGLPLMPDDPEPEAEEPPPDASVPSRSQPASKAPLSAIETAATSVVTFMLTSRVVVLLVKEQLMDRGTDFRKIVLFTGGDGRARFREESVPLTEGTPQAMLSAVQPASGCQLRYSPIGFRSAFHCTARPQWVFILGGEMEIGLQDGSSRLFKPGEHFFSADVLPDGARFDAKVHGHWSAQRGAHPLTTLFLKT